MYRRPLAAFLCGKNLSLYRTCRFHSSYEHKTFGGLVQPLFEGPIDIIGDIHGETGDFFHLLDMLGYDGNGRHKEGRRLVFVGDLVDRGPDSIGIVNFVRKLVEGGEAQMVLGNHELNLMRGSRKHGNAWFWGEPEVIRKDHAALSFQLLADEEFRTATLGWLRTLPVALSRSDVKVVHACWHDETIARLQKFDGDAITAYKHFSAEVEKELEGLPKLDSAEDDEDRRDLAVQNHNPVLVTVSGMEEKAAEPFWAGGKMRRLDRKKWWTEYSGEALVVFGHYWRLFPRPSSTPAEFKDFDPTGGNLFPGASPFQLLGGGGGCACVDFGVGVRYEERARRLAPGGFGAQLGALRLPEREVWVEDGRKEKLLAAST